MRSFHSMYLSNKLNQQVRDSNLYNYHLHLLYCMQNMCNWQNPWQGYTYYNKWNSLFCMFACKAGIRQPVRSLEAQQVQLGQQERKFSWIIIINIVTFQYKKFELQLLNFKAQFKLQKQQYVNKQSKYACIYQNYCNIDLQKFSKLSGMGNCNNLSSEKPQKRSNGQKLKLQFTSAIINDKTMSQIFDFQILQKIAKKLSNTPLQLKLIYRASQNGFTCQSFHRATDRINNTILIVKTVQNKIFGAFSPCTWRKDIMYQYQVDQKSQGFLFSIRFKNEVDQYNSKRQQKTQHKEKQKKKNKKQEKGQIDLKIYEILKNEKALMNHATSGPIYGEGHDIMISDKCDKNENWCNLGKTYNTKHPFGSIKANSQLAGQTKFLVSEYQIWAFQF